MNRILALLLLAAAATPSHAAERRFSLPSFDRIRMEAPFDVALSTNKSPSASAEGSVAALDTVDLKVEGRTLIVRQRSGWNGEGKGAPIRISLATPALQAATLVGSGRLQIDRMSGLSVSLALAGPGLLKVADLRADRLNLVAGGSGIVALAGAVKTGNVSSEGSVVLDAAGLAAEELVLVATGSSELRAAARRSVNVAASGASTVTLKGPVACIQKVIGAATVSGCR
jgi:hypothetical protein